MKKIYNTVILFVATGMFIGYLPFAPGTFGSVLGIALSCFASEYLDTYQSLMLLGTLLVIGNLAAGKAEKILNEQDSGKIVIDEIAGIYITLLFIPPGIVPVIIGFLCFRALDISKPYPISYLDKNVHGGIGIMLDDVAAGIAANIFVRILIFLLEILIGRSL
ncbi:MAG: phosphatidylglycerophosphatase A [Deltaproteobacteria bacterium]|nr:phosphatidylglycerophosphatase A [Deltaproteobacteria bacterium]MCL5878321.1 phosphatidylglycerophosphatase A [Deltaproteobacteria bacterium]